MTNSEHIAAFTAFLRKADEWSRIAEADEKEAFAQRLDIEHRLELHDDDYRTTARLGKLLRQVNRRRRAAKTQPKRSRLSCNGQRKPQGAERPRSGARRDAEDRGAAEKPGLYAPDGYFAGDE